MGTTWTTTAFSQTEGRLSSLLENLPDNCGSKVFLTKMFINECVAVRWDPSKPPQNVSFARQTLFLHVGYYMGVLGCRRSTLYLPSSSITSARAGQACIQLLAAANFADCGMYLSVQLRYGLVNDSTRFVRLLAQSLHIRRRSLRYARRLVGYTRA